MLPGGGSGRTSGDGSGTEASCSRQLVRVRRLVVSSLPPSPIEAVACPTMLFFLLSFYALHGLAVLLLQRASAPSMRVAREACPTLMAYALDLCTLAAAMALVHLARVLPIMLAKCSWMREKDGADPRNCPRTGSRLDEDAEDEAEEQGWLQPQQSPRSARFDRAGTAKRWAALSLLVLLEAAQRTAWIALQLLQLRDSWTAYMQVDGILDALKLTEQTRLSSATALGPLASTSVRGVTDPISVGLASDGSMLCGQAGSMHLVRWTLVCVVVTTALALSLLLVVVQDGIAAAHALLRRVFAQAKRARRGLFAHAWALLVRRACCARSRRRGSDARSHADTSPAAADSPAGHRWLDLQTDEVPGDEDQSLA